MYFLIFFFAQKCNSFDLITSCSFLDHFIMFVLSPGSLFVSVCTENYTFNGKIKFVFMTLIFLMNTSNEYSICVL